MTGSAERVELVLTSDAAAVRARVDPVAWVVLEELAARAEVVDGVVVAAASARSLASVLGRSADSVARALRLLAADGLVERVEGRHDRSGRFVGVRFVVDLRAAGLRLPTTEVNTAGSPWPVTPTTHDHAAAAQRPPAPHDPGARLF